eukprot:TRINITY_DN4364_c0_g2_i1.p1 TRINITY_DN4364_c0_g2~~TRINITY_DN4364_c0_g2_i1.p1  ORF type:complete len:155 (-),score=17.89 TRINITY_DN4364_c0_g2_i1:4-468(-)
MCIRDRCKENEQKRFEFRTPKAYRIFRDSELKKSYERSEGEDAVTAVKSFYDVRRILLRNKRHGTLLRAARRLLRGMWPTCGSFGVFDHLPWEIFQIILSNISGPNLPHKYHRPIRNFSQTKQVIQISNFEDFFSIITSSLGETNYWNCWQGTK